MDGINNDPGNDPEPAVPTLNMAFEANGIPGGFRMGRFHIYEYPILQAYLAALPSPINWPPAESLILDAASGTVICQARQLRIKGFVAASGLTMRLFLDISDWDLATSLELPACDRVMNVEFPMSYELQQIAILMEEAGEEFWFNPQTDKRIDLRVPGEYLILQAQGVLARHQIRPYRA